MIVHINKDNPIFWKFDVASDVEITIEMAKEIQGRYGYPSENYELLYFTRRHNDDGSKKNEWTWVMPNPTIIDKHGKR